MILLAILQDCCLNVIAKLKHIFKIKFYLVCTDSFKSRTCTVLQFPIEVPSYIQHRALSKWVPQVKGS